MAQPSSPLTVAPDVAPPASARERRLAAQSRLRKMIEHMNRCRPLGRPGQAEISRIVGEYLARGGVVRRCEPAFALAVQNGAGRDAERW